MQREEMNRLIEQHLTAEKAARGDGPSGRTGLQ